KKIKDTLKDYVDDDVIKNLVEIIESVEAVKKADFKMVFDPTLVRGMGYYTGTIFEIALPQFGGACGGGGRYDKMVGNFTGTDVPACGFSIGFERIVLLLMENGFEIPGSKDKVAYLVEKDMPKDKYAEILNKAMNEREKGIQVLVTKMNKNKKFQKEQLSAEGYTSFEEFYSNPLN
ncbi:MAG: ATP phosphoribosyltransferase regulatory subunit, partial [Lachnospiraceae bacterium]|nr:ATP phosphoribosyltransferase regulatory subunit [Lachnospiraceae bacterium]